MPPNTPQGHNLSHSTRQGDALLQLMSTQLCSTDETCMRCGGGRMFQHDCGMLADLIRKAIWRGQFYALPFPACHVQHAHSPLWQQRLACLALHNPDSTNKTSMFTRLLWRCLQTQAVCGMQRVSSPFHAARAVSCGSTLMLQCSCPTLGSTDKAHAVREDISLMCFHHEYAMEAREGRLPGRRF